MRKQKKKIFFVRLQTVSVYACHIDVCDVIGEILLLECKRNVTLM